MLLRALIDGMAADRVCVCDRGLQYADGLFETIAVRDGLPCLWPQHLDRLKLGAKRLGIPPLSDDLLRRECLQLVGDHSAAVLKIILTRGRGGRGYRPPETPVPTRILSLHPWPKYPASWSQQGVAMIRCQTPLSENSALAGLKHLGRLEQVLARAEWRDSSISEGLMQDGGGRAIGGTMSNLFLVRGKRLLTPRLDRCGIAGTVRALVLRLAAKLGIEVVQCDIPGEDLEAADGMFLTNALMGVWPVRSLDDREFALQVLPGKLISAVRHQAFTPQ